MIVVRCLPLLCLWRRSLFFSRWESYRQRATTSTKLGHARGKPPRQQQPNADRTGLDRTEKEAGKAAEENMQHDMQHEPGNRAAKGPHGRKGCNTKEPTHPNTQLLKQGNLPNRFEDDIGQDATPRCPTIAGMQNKTALEPDGTG
jgi:hypothetical protein